LKFVHAPTLARISKQISIKPYIMQHTDLEKAPVVHDRYPAPAQNHHFKILSIGALLEQS